MWFTRLSIQRPVFVVVLMITMFVLGIRSKSGMNIDLNPPVNFPYVTVTTTYAGDSPTEMETLVSKPIEDAVSSVNGIQHITSTSQYGISSVEIEFQIGIDPLSAENQVREKVDAARSSLPKDIDPPTVSRFDMAALPVLYAGMITDLSPKQARFEVVNVVQPLVSQVQGVSKVDVAGGDIREIQVNVARSQLAAYGLSITDIVNALESANVNVPAGHIQEGKYDFDARVLGEFTSVDQIRNLRIPVPSGDPSNPRWINLSDVASVIDTTAERTQIVRLWRQDKHHKMKVSNTVGIIISKDSDANTVSVVDGAKSVLAQLEKTLPGNTRFIISSDNSTIVKNSLRDVNFSLWAGALLAVFVVFMFLHELRGTIICAVAIPLSLIATFIPMYFAGFTLNNMTMLALSLVVGILVDDSIVVLENIYRHLHRGELSEEAAYNGRSEIGLAAITITMSDVVVFLPMAFMGGIVGQFFRQFGLTVACATLVSLMVSFSVTPMLAARLYRNVPDIETPTNKMAIGFERGYRLVDRAYRKILRWALHHRWMVVFSGAGALLVALFVFGPLLGFQFTPVTDQGQIIVTCELPTGSSLDASNAVSSEVERRLASMPDIKSMFVDVGSLTGGALLAPQLGGQYSQISVNLTDKASALQAIIPFFQGHFRKRPDFEIAADMRKRLSDIAGVRILVIPVSGYGGASAPVDMELLGFDLKRMEAIGNQIKDRMATIPGLTSPDISLRPGKPEADIIIDRTRAAVMGLSVAQIGAAVHAAFAGDTTVKYRDRGDEFDVRVQLRDLDRSNVEQIKNLVVATRQNAAGSASESQGYQPIYLRDVASVQMNAGPTEVDRLDRQRVVHVTAYMAPGVSLGNIQQELIKATRDIPLGDIHLAWGGQAEMMQREFGYLFSSIALSIILVYLLMAALFDNMLYPLVIQMSLPMALVGAIMALVITHMQMSIITMIGVIMLVGLVQKNSILLIDYTNTLRGRGLPRDEAILQAGPTRLRPILMTTIAMILGMMPSALQIGASSESRAPLAICVIGGLIVSSLLSLVMVPTVYSMADDLQNWVIRKIHRDAAYSRTKIRKP